MVAVQPMFVVDRETLLQELRLSGIDRLEDVNTIVDTGIRQFRVTVTHRLGFVETNALAATPYVEAPTTPEEFRRFTATQLEVFETWCILLDRLSVRFADNSGGDFQSFNEEGVWRQVDSTEKEQFFQRCSNQIEEYYDILTAVEEQGDDCTINVFDGTDEPEASSIYFPGGSVFRQPGPFRGNNLVPVLSVDILGFRTDPPK